MEIVINESQESGDQAAMACISAVAESEGGVKKPAASVGKRRCLLFLLALALVWGFLTGFLEEDSSFLAFFDYAVQIVCVFGVLVWCLLDSEERNFRLTKKMSLAIILILVVAFPYYIARTRKSWETLWTFGLSVLFAAFFFGLCFVGEYIGIFFYNLKDGYWGLG